MIFFSAIARILCTLVLALPMQAMALPFTQLVVFGDSLVDGGNNAAMLDSGALGLANVGVRQSVPLPSNGAIPTPPYAGSDNYSNGPVWVQQFATQLGLPLTPSLLGGTNFAFGGAKTGPVDPGPGITVFPRNMLSQVDDFIARPGTASADTLFILNGGGNDLRRVFDPVPVAPATIITDYVTNIVTMLNELWAEGARQFLVSTVPDVGKTPLAVERGVAAVAGGTQLAVAMNQALQSTLLAVLDPDVLDSVTFLDLFGLQQTLALDPAAFGIDDLTTGCASSLSCIGDPSRTFFWDGIHPTTAGHRAIALAAFTLTVSEPGTLTLCLLASALFMRSPRRQLRSARMN